MAAAGNMSVLVFAGLQFALALGLICCDIASYAMLGGILTGFTSSWTGIPLGIFFMITAGCGLAAAKASGKGPLIASLVMSILSMIVAFSMGIWVVAVGLITGLTNEFFIAAGISPADGRSELQNLQYAVMAFFFLESVMCFIMLIVASVGLCRSKRSTTTTSVTYVSNQPNVATYGKA